MLMGTRRNEAGITVNGAPHVFVPLQGDAKTADHPCTFVGDDEAGA